jgi:hypothetical protein
MVGDGSTINIAGPIPVQSISPDKLKQETAFFELIVIQI